MVISYSQLRVGLALPERQKRVTQEEINLYAQASHDFNPIHIDPEFARKSPAGGTIAHGMLILAYVSQMLTDAFGRDWLTSGHFNIRFKMPARPGDLLTIQGRIEKVQPQIEVSEVSCSVLCSNQTNETVITGEATVRVKND